jgi:prephenate dehydratase
MADTIKTVTYFSLTVPNKPGEGARLLAGLEEAGVNLTGLWGYPVKGKLAQIDLAPEDAKAFAKVARKLGASAAQKQTAILVQGKDRVGALTAAMAKLAAVGVNVHAAQAIASGVGRFGCLLQVSAADLKKAKKVLGVK